MNRSEIKALTFDTGGTVLDWHTGFREAFAAAGARHGLEGDWAALANNLRRRSLGAMLNHGADGPLSHNMDDAHRFCLDAVIAEHGLVAFDDADRRAIAWDAPHSFTAWPDVREGLAALRHDRICVSFTILTYRLIVDTARANGLVWDAVLSCEGLGLYKLLPDSYRRAAARLQLAPGECMMVASHPFDLDVARRVGFRTALVRRPAEWGSTPPDAPMSEGGYDFEVDGFDELAQAMSD